MRKKLSHAVLALAVVLALGAATSRPAEARRGGVAAGIAVGTLLGLGIAGAYARSRYYGAGHGPRLLSGSPPVQLGGPQLLDQSLRRAHLQRRRLALLAPDHLRLKRWRVSSSLLGFQQTQALHGGQVQRHGGGVGDVEAGYRRRRWRCGASRSQLSCVSWRRPLPSAPSTSAERTGQASSSIRSVAASSSRPMTMTFELLELGQSAGEVLNQRDRHVLERAGGRFRKRAGERRAVAAGHDQAAGAERRAPSAGWRRRCAGRSPGRAR